MSTIITNVVRRCLETSVGEISVGKKRQETKVNKEIKLWPDEEAPSSEMRTQITAILKKVKINTVDQIQVKSHRRDSQMYYYFNNFCFVPCANLKVRNTARLPKKNSIKKLVKS
jgi:hypothetical protein